MLTFFAIVVLLVVVLGAACLVSDAARGCVVSLVWCHCCLGDVVAVVGECVKVVLSNFTEE